MLPGLPDLYLVSVLGSHASVPLFWDAAVVLAEQLVARGLRVRLAANELAKQGKNFVFGAHGIGAILPPGTIPPGSIIVNSEPFAAPAQVAGFVEWNRYLPMFDGMHVFDYSQRNIASFQAANIPALSYSWLPVGFADRNVLSRIEPVLDVDVLFYGRINPRRAQVLASCRQLGLNLLEVTSGCFGPSRADYFARAKVILNVGAVDSSVFEQYRVSYAMNNNKAVVTEMHLDEGLSTRFESALCVSSYENLAASCARVVASETERMRLERNAPIALLAINAQRHIDIALQRINCAPNTSLQPSPDTFNHAPNMNYHQTL